MTGQNILEDPFIQKINSLLENDLSLIKVETPSDFSVKLPERKWDIPNEDLEGLLLKITGLNTYFLYELSKIEHRRRLLKEKYEYLYKHYLLIRINEIAIETGYDLPSLKKGNPRKFDCAETVAKEETKLVKDVLEAFEASEKTEGLYFKLKNVLEILRSYDECIGKVISFRQSEIRLATKLGQ